MILTMSVVAQAAVLDVGVGQAYPTVTDALAVAANGDEIVLHDPAITEAIVVDGLDVTIKAATRTTWNWRFDPAWLGVIELRNAATVRVSKIDFVGRLAASSYPDGILVGDGSLRVEDSSFERFDTGISGGALSAIRVGGSVFRNHVTSAIRATDASIEVARSAFLRNGSPTFGASSPAISSDGPLAFLEVRDSLFARNRSWTGAVTCEGCRITDSLFVDNVGEFPSVIHAWRDVELERNRFCGNTADAMAILIQQAPAAVLRNNAFLDNEGWSALHADNAVISLEHNTFVGNDGPLNVAIFGDSTVTMVGNLVAQNLTAYDAFDSGGVSTVTASYGAWYDNLNGDGPLVGATDLAGVDPLLAGIGGACSWDRIRPQAGSPLIDGNPTLLDLDGTPADIGATGGPHAP